MSHLFRFIGEEVAADAGAWALVEEEALHLAKVLRLDVGDDVEVTDGKGRWATARVEVSAAKRCVVRVLGAGDGGGVQIEPAPEWKLTVCIGALKPGLIDEILPAMVELGVDRVCVFQQQESAKSRLTDKAVERWQRIVVQAIKQCKRAWLPEVRVFEGVGEMLRDVQGGRRYLLLPDAEGTLLDVLTAAAAPAAPDVILAIGGEKGFSSFEDTSLRAAGFSSARLGGFVLRAVTAAISACSVASAVRSRTGP